jgi:hypothetical protein
MDHENNQTNWFDDMKETIVGVGIGSASLLASATVAQSISEWAQAGSAVVGFGILVMTFIQLARRLRKENRQ